jgi:hypothetical protein
MVVPPPPPEPKPVKDCVPPVMFVNVKVPVIELNEPPVKAKLVP